MQDELVEMRIACFRRRGLGGGSVWGVGEKGGEGKGETGKGEADERMRIWTGKSVSLTQPRIQV